MRTEETGAHRRRVVILGRGFAGRAAARAPVDVTVIDRRNHHLFQPLVCQVATAALSPAEIACPIREVLRRQRKVRVMMGDVEGVDLEAREVLASGRRHPRDAPILAIGARHACLGRDARPSVPAATGEAHPSGSEATARRGPSDRGAGSGRGQIASIGRERPPSPMMRTCLRPSRRGSSTPQDWAIVSTSRIKLRA